MEVVLYSAKDQEGSQDAKVWKLGDAIRERVVDNETLGYYMARTYLFLVAVGVDPERLRFRQHMSNEMAHYATARLFPLSVHMVLGLLGRRMPDFIRLD